MRRPPFDRRERRQRDDPDIRDARHQAVLLPQRPTPDGPRSPRAGWADRYPQQAAGPDVIADLDGAIAWTNDLLSRIDGRLALVEIGAKHLLGDALHQLMAFRVEHVAIECRMGRLAERVTTWPR